MSSGALTWKRGVCSASTLRKPKKADSLRLLFVAKPLLDTLVYRAGSLVGAAYFTAAMGWGLTPAMRQYLLLGVAAAWAANSYWVGLLAEREQAAREAGANRQTELL